MVRASRLSVTSGGAVEERQKWCCLGGVKRVGVCGTTNAALVRKSNMSRQMG